MTKEFLKYLDSIDMRASLERIGDIYKFYKGISPYEITDIFVSVNIKNDGSREYENLKFFSEKYIMEAKQFLTNDNFDNTPIKNRIVHWELKKEYYDFIYAREKSKLYLNITLDTGAKCDFKASRENCDHLRDIFIKHIVPNLKE